MSINIFRKKYILIVLFCLYFLVGCFSKNNEIYGSWSGRAVHHETYKLISGKLPTKEKNDFEDIDANFLLTISKDICVYKISLNPMASNTLKCEYDQKNDRVKIFYLDIDDDERKILHDSGLIINKLEKEKLYLSSNMSILYSEEGSEYEYHLKETYVMNKVLDE